MSSAPSISVIISTYNAVDWLKKTLWGYAIQTTSDFEIVIADDGSGPETKELIDKFKLDFPVPIIHVWQEDHGFQKTKILNKAIKVASSSYIVTTDGDCIPKNDFLEQHLTFREPGYFLSGGYFKLPLDISMSISKEDIDSQACFQLEWLKERGLKSSIKNQKLTTNKGLASVLNNITPTKPSWNGHNASGWKKDILSVNGFDERMQYGGEDREMGERLINMGIKAKQIRYSAICVHLEHSRGYINNEALKLNASIRKNTKQKEFGYTYHGIKKNQDAL